MNPNCIKAVTAAAGKPLSAGKIKAIEQAMVKKSRELAYRDSQLPPNQRQWSSLSKDQRNLIAAEEAMKDIAAKAAHKEANAFRQILANNRNDEWVTAWAKEKGTTRSKAWIKRLDLISHTIQAKQNHYFGQLSDMLDAVQITDGVGVKRWLGMKLFDLDNPAMTRDVVREIWKNADGSTGNAAAKKAAQAWLKTTEDMRLAFNNAGGAIGKLGYGYLTQIHDAAKIGKAGAQRWGDFVMQRLDRSAYLREDGSRMDDTEVRSIVDQSFNTLKNDGFDPLDAGKFKGTGAKANAGSESRVLHFRDGDAWMEYMDEFGRGSLYDAMQGHIRGMAKNITLVEELGPNAEQTVRVQNDLASQDKGLAGREWAITPQQRWDIISGRTGTPDNELWANVGSGLRLHQTATLLGSAVLSSITDIGTVRAGIHFNKLSYFEFLKNWKTTAWEEAKGLAGGRKYLQQELQTHGIIVDSLIDGLNRWTGDNMATNAAGRVAGAVMKLSLMNAWTDSIRRAYRMTLESAGARITRKGWGELEAWDQMRFKEHGIDAADWEIIKAATPETIGGREFMTTRSIVATGAEGAEQTALKWMAAMSDESEFGVVNPDLTARAITTFGGMQAGTIKGEMARTATQFMSFPISMVTRHWGRVFETPQGLEGAPLGYGGAQALRKVGVSEESAAMAARLGALAAFTISLGMLGGVAMQLKALAAGKDPINMDPTEDEGATFWRRAMAQGGGLSYAGNLLFDPQKTMMAGAMEKPMSIMLGPVGGTVGALGDLTIGNLQQLAMGEETDLGPEALRLINRQIPGQSLWWFRNVWQRNFIDQAQEAMNPNYLARMKARQAKDGTTWWWEPGDRLPDQAPDLSKAVEQ